MATIDLKTKLREEKGFEIEGNIGWLQVQAFREVHAIVTSWQK